MASSSVDVIEVAGERKKFKPFRAFKRMFRDGKKGAKLSKSRGNLTDLSEDEGEPGGYRYKGPYAASSLNRRISLSHDSIFTPEVAQLSADFRRTNPTKSENHPITSEKRSSEDQVPIAGSSEKGGFKDNEKNRDMKEKTSTIAQQLTMLLNRSLEPSTPKVATEEGSKESEPKPTEETSSPTVEISPPEADLSPDMDTVLGGTSQQPFLNNSAAYDKIAARPKNRKTRTRGQKRPVSAIVKSTEPNSFWNSGDDLFNKTSYSFKEPRSESFVQTEEKVLESPKEKEKPEEKATVKKTHSFKGPSVMSPLEDIKMIKLRKTPTEERNDFTSPTTNSADNKDIKSTPKSGPLPKPRWNKVLNTPTSPVATESPTSPDNNVSKYSPPKVKKRTESSNKSSESESTKKSGFKPNWLNLTPNKNENSSEETQKVESPPEKSMKKLSPVDNVKPITTKEDKTEEDKTPKEESNYLAVLEKKRNEKKDSFKKDKLKSPIIAKTEEKNMDSEKSKEVDAESPQQNPFAKLKKVKKDSKETTSSPNTEPSSVQSSLVLDEETVKSASPVSKLAFFKAKMEDDKSSNTKPVERKHSGRKSFPAKPVVVEKESIVGFKAKMEDDKLSNTKPVERKHSDRKSFPAKPVITEKESIVGFKAKMEDDKLSNTKPVERKHSDRKSFPAKAVITEKESIVDNPSKQNEENATTNEEIKSPLVKTASNTSTISKQHDNEPSSIFPVKLRKTSKSSKPQTKDLQNEEKKDDSKNTPHSKQLSPTDKSKPSIKESHKSSGDLISDKKVNTIKVDENSNSITREEIKKNEIKKSPKPSASNSKGHWQSNSSKEQLVKKSDSLPVNKDETSKQNSEKIVPKWKIPAKPEKENNKSASPLSNGQKSEKTSTPVKSPTPKSPSKSNFVSGSNYRTSWNKNNSNIVIKDTNDAIKMSGPIEIKEHPLETETKPNSPPIVAKKPKIKRKLSSKQADTSTADKPVDTKPPPEKEVKSPTSPEATEEKKDQNENVAPSEGPAWVSLARRRSRKWENNISTTKNVTISESQAEVLTLPTEEKSKPAEKRDIQPVKQPPASSKNLKHNSKSMEENRSPMTKSTTLRSISSDTNAQSKVQVSKSTSYPRGLPPAVESIKPNPPPWLAIAMEKQKRWVDGTV